MKGASSGESCLIDGGPRSTIFCAMVSVVFNHTRDDVFSPCA